MLQKFAATFPRDRKFAIIPKLRNFFLGYFTWTGRWPMRIQCSIQHASTESVFQISAFWRVGISITVDSDENDIHVSSNNLGDGDDPEFPELLHRKNKVSFWTNKRRQNVLKKN